jgi:hypothetical protein
MTYPLPIRSGGSPQDHVDDHNELHGIIGLGLPTNLTTGSSDHFAHHVLLHGVLNRTLGQTLPATAPEGAHLSIHNTIHALLNIEKYGPRSTPGQRASGSVPGFPSVFSSTHSNWASLQAAVNAAGTGRKFRLTVGGSWVATAPIVPHAGDEFWAELGVTITQNTSVARAFDNSSNVPNTKYMNLNIGAFVERAIYNLPTAATNSEIGYCTVDGFGTMTNGIAATWRHHCIVKRIAFESPLASFEQDDGIIEDCEIGPSPGGAGNKMLGTKRMQVRHNRFIGQGTTGQPFLQGAGIWWDYNNQDVMFEWNICEDNNGPGIALEANHWDDDTNAPGVFTNTIRYNKFQNNGSAAVLISSSAFTEVYGNTMYQNNAFDGSGSVSMGLVAASQAPHPGGQGGELKQNHVYNNYVKPLSNKRGAQYNVQDNVTDYAAYVTNTKDNTWNNNTYDFVDPATTNLFTREAVNTLTFAQWKAGNIPATAGAQDVNSVAI